MGEVLTETREDDFDDRLLFCDSGPTQERQAQRERLEREVIEAAKAWKQKADDGENEKWRVHYVKMCDAIQALIDFESQIKT